MEIPLSSSSVSGLLLFLECQQLEVLELEFHHVSSILAAEGAVAFVGNLDRKSVGVIFKGSCCSFCRPLKEPEVDGWLLCK